MPRPPKYDSDQILDATLRLLGAGGLAGTSVPALTRELGIPSGSVYYRFPSRTALLGELWLRSTTRLLRRVLVPLQQQGPSDVMVVAQRSVLEWVRAEPAEAGVVLLEDRRTLAPGEWPDVLNRRAERIEADLATAVVDVADRVLGGGRDAERRVRFVLFDLPAVALRPAFGLPPEGGIAALVEEAGRNVIARPVERPSEGPVDRRPRSRLGRRR